MIFSPFRRNRQADTISALYGTIVAQARLPCFYLEYGVPDTVNGRFDLLVLHLVVVLERLAGNEGGAELSQLLFDRFCRDMDDNLREIGIADLKVPKEMRRIGEAFYGRAQAYRTALADAGDMALAEAVARNVYGGMPTEPGLPRRLAGYMRVSLRELRSQQADRIANGDLRWPDPAVVPAPAHEDPKARV
jgi:cytochrome b pre-mRNA-processing protein 3